MNSAPSSAAALASRCQLERAGGLRAHGDRQLPGGFAHHGFRHLQPLVEGHGGKVAGGAAGQQRAVFLGDAVVEQEAHVAPRGRQIQFQVRVPEHGGNGDVATFEPFLCPFEIHAPHPLWLGQWRELSRGGSDSS